MVNSGWVKMWLGRVGLVGLCGLLFALPYYSVIKYYSSDPELTLLVSQTILEQGTTRLDGYVDEVVLGRPFTTFINSLQMVERNGHLYNYFPTGPAVLALPAVAVARLVGWDMRQVDGNYVLQGYLAALSVVAVFLIMHQTARLYLDERASLVMSVTATMGSTIMSTMGTALWSINFATFFAALSLYLLAKGSKAWSRFTPYWLGVWLFCAFFARVSAAAFIAPVLLYLFLYERRVVGKTAVSALTLLILFLAWSRLEFGEWLPAYYSTARLVADRVAMWVGVYGNLLSPSRGIFVFSPFLGLGVLGAIMGWRRWRERPLIPLILIWLTLLLLVIARGASWWGGVSFGPRLLTEIVPGLALLLILIWRDLAPVLRSKQRRFWIGTYALLAVLAVGIHSFQGLYNVYAAEWNTVTNPLPELPALGLGDLFNWRYTQVFASPDWNCAIAKDKTLTLLEHLPNLAHYRLGQEIYYDEAGFEDDLKAQIERLEAAPGSSLPTSPGLNHRLFLPTMMNFDAKAVLIGFAAPPGKEEPESYCREFQVVFRLRTARQDEGMMRLVLMVEPYGKQRLLAVVNGVMVGEQLVDGETAVTFDIPSDLLNFDGLNEIEIKLPDATFTGLRGNGYQSLIFSQAILYPTEATNLHPTLTSPSAYP